MRERERDEAKCYFSVHICPYCIVHNTLVACTRIVSVWAPMKCESRSTYVYTKIPYKIAPSSSPLSSFFFSFCILIGTSFSILFTQLSVLHLHLYLHRLILSSLSSSSSSTSTSTSSVDSQ